MTDVQTEVPGLVDHCWGVEVHIHDDHCWLPKREPQVKWSFVYIDTQTSRRMLTTTVVPRPKLSTYVGNTSNEIKHHAGYVHQDAHKHACHNSQGVTESMS